MKSNPVDKYLLIWKNGCDILLGEKNNMYLLWAFILCYTNVNIYIYMERFHQAIESG